MEEKKKRVKIMQSDHYAEKNTSSTEKERNGIPYLQRVFGNDDNRQTFISP